MREEKETRQTTQESERVNMGFEQIKMSGGQAVQLLVSRWLV